MGCVVSYPDEDLFLLGVDEVGDVVAGNGAGVVAVQYFEGLGIFVIGNDAMVLGSEQDVILILGNSIGERYINMKMLNVAEVALNYVFCREIVEPFSELKSTGFCLHPCIC